MVAFLTLVTATPVGAQVPPPTVSPTPLSDVPPTVGDPFPFFDNYSWRSFIALNWPAKSGPANRGLPDTNKSFGDAAGPRAWMTWKSRYEVFQPGGATPSPWASYDGANPCGAGFSNDVVTLRSFSAFNDFNQAVFNLSKVGSPLVAQNQTYVRYEVRINQPEFNSIVGHKWYIASNLPKDAASAKPFNAGSTEVKAAWRILTEKDTPAIRARYYVVPKAQVFDVASSKCVLKDIALVGFHIVTKTPERPQWIWSSFEHVDNVPGVTDRPTPAAVPLSFNDPNKPQALNPPRMPPSISATNPPVASPVPMQVIRKQTITPQTMSMNKDYWNLPQIKGTVWENYMLVMTQWPTQVAPENPTNDGAPFPTSGSALANTTMETYFQSEGASCMECHNISNDTGRDFVMFVTFDAFRPGTPAASEMSLSKMSAAKARANGVALRSDPLVKSLTDFFNAKDR
jgi:hypothetical protein